MEKIKFIKKITDYINRERTIIGDCVYYVLSDHNVIKLYCYDLGVKAIIINKSNGTVDEVSLPFSNYFKPTKCGPNDREWTQYITHGNWYFSNIYTHVLPSDDDYTALAHGIEEYMKLFE